MLRVDNLKIRGLPVISLEVSEGECIAIQGPSGSGKSLLLRGIADLDPAQGLIFLDGAERCEMTAPEWRKQVRYVAAESGWWTETPRAHFLASKCSARWLSGLGLTDAHLDRSVARLSTGERQRLSLIRAISDNPKVLLLDEPTSALDQGSMALAEELIRFQVLSDLSVIIVTHDEEQAQRLASRRYILSSDGLEEAK